MTVNRINARALFIMAVLGPLMLGQTKSSLNTQVQAPSTPTPVFLMVLPLAGGGVGFAMVVPDPVTMTLDTTTTPYTMRAKTVAPTPPPAYNYVRLSRITTGTSTGSWALPSTPISRLVGVQRNGVLQWPGQDYDIQADGSVRFRSGPGSAVDPSLPDDIVAALVVQ